MIICMASEIADIHSMRILYVRAHFQWMLNKTAIVRMLRFIIARNLKFDFLNALKSAGNFVICRNSIAKVTTIWLGLVNKCSHYVCRCEAA